MLCIQTKAKPGRAATPSATFRCVNWPAAGEGGHTVWWNDERSFPTITLAHKLLPWGGNVQQWKEALKKCYFWISCTMTGPARQRPALFVGCLQKVTEEEVAPLAPRTPKLVIQSDCIRCWWSVWVRLLVRFACDSSLFPLQQRIIITIATKKLQMLQTRHSWLLNMYVSILAFWVMAYGNCVQI